MMKSRSNGRNLTYRKGQGVEPLQTDSAKPQTMALPMQLKKPSRWAQLKRELYRNRHYYILMSPYMIIFFLFTVIPVVLSFLSEFFLFQLCSNFRDLSAGTIIPGCF